LAIEKLGDILVSMKNNEAFDVDMNSSVSDSTSLTLQ
jgi:hypothetical protein